MDSSNLSSQSISRKTESGSEIPGDFAFAAQSSPRKSLPLLLLIVFAWILIYVPGLASPPLLDDADSVHAEAAREMLTRNDYVTLHANGVRYLEKAPLVYWLTAGSYAQFGFNEFATRLPLALFVLALLFAVYNFGKSLAGVHCGFFAALVMATAVGPYIYTRFFIPDIVVGLWLTLTVHVFWKAIQQERPSAWLCWSIGLLTALDVLTKGLIGIVFPVAIIFGYFLLTGDWKRLWKIRPFSTVAVFLVVALPWHLLAILRNPPQGEAKGFFWFYFINEQIYRFLNKRIPHDYDRVPLLLFWGLILVWMFPWSPFFAAAVRRIPWRLGEIRKQLSREGQATLLLALWAIVVVGFFSFSTRQEYYVLPALPAIALLIAVWLAQENASAPESSVRRFGLIFSRILLAIGILAFLVSAAIILIAPALPKDADFANLLQTGRQAYTLSMGHLFDLTLTAMSAFRVPLAITGGGLLVGSALNLWFRKRNRCLAGNLSLAAMMAAQLFAVHLALGIFNPVLGSKLLATKVLREYSPGDLVVLDGEYVNGSSVGFYTGIQLHMLNGRINGLWYGALFPDSPKVFENDESFAQLWCGNQRVFFLTFDSKGPERLRALQAPYFELMHSGEKAVFSNQNSKAK